jgi:hypothetical protein
LKHHGALLPDEPDLRGGVQRRQTEREDVPVTELFSEPVEMPYIEAALRRAGEPERVAGDTVVRLKGLSGDVGDGGVGEIGLTDLSSFISLGAAKKRELHPDPLGARKDISPCWNEVSRVVPPLGFVFGVASVVTR